jgi:hypothetical protein
MRLRVDDLTEIRISVGKRFKAHWQCLYHRSHMFAREIYRATKPKFLHPMRMFRRLSSLEYLLYQNWTDHGKTNFVECR